MKQTVTILILSLMLVGCGQNNSNERVLDKESKTHFGILSDATVKIYGLEEGSKRLLFEEKTTMGRTVDEIGNFDPHVDALESTKFYFYEVSGGENWDNDKDGLVDTTPTINSRIYKAVYKGNKSHVAWWRTEIKSDQPKNSEK